MTKTKKAKLSKSDGLQVVVLPEGIHLDGDEVEVCQDARLGDITIRAPRPPFDWAGFIAFRDEHPISDEEWRAFEEALSEARGRPLFGDH